jgi:hypothetical protein
MPSMEKQPMNQRLAIIKQDVLHLSLNGINKVTWVSNIIKSPMNKYPLFYRIRPKSSDAG